MKLGAGTRSEGEVRYIMKADNGNKGLDAGRIVAVRGNNKATRKRRGEGWYVCDGVCVYVCMCYCGSISSVVLVELLFSC